MYIVLSIPSVRVLIAFKLAFSPAATKHFLGEKKKTVYIHRLNQKDKKERLGGEGVRYWNTNDKCISPTLSNKGVAWTNDKGFVH